MVEAADTTAAYIRLRELARAANIEPLRANPMQLVDLKDIGGGLIAEFDHVVTGKSSLPKS